MYSANVYKIFLASPSDVAKERQVARDTINKWNELHSEETGIILQAIGWETHSFSSMGDRAQGVLNKQILQDADFLIGMFWTRIGTPTGDHESGTLEEIKEHIDAGKPAMICFSDQPVQMGSVEQEQYNKLMEFKKECYEKGLVTGYDSLEAFKTIINDSLVRRTNKKEPFIGFSSVKSDVETPIVIDMTAQLSSAKPVLPPDAKELLIEASNDSGGDIIKLAYLGGATLQTNGRNFLSDGTAREKAKWEAALNYLVDEGLVEGVGYKGEMFRVTHSGYQLADQLKNA
ncbi:DUF4062 domain-containing protein [Shewanella baltica]|uniref:hypothetical protein n=1 Tax=Shewanella TaxID=22 RepID=UPI00217E0BAC|nr:hypothetical protein [Shewanella baltica]MCS6232794.1 DUF4062 domain-containing protein [Shewanella baltica]